ncbi:MAG TPA: DUF1707 domain-containing protein [Nocardioides sp.]|nr:DUF1707 domain-containing protein [Nocardioides sp.]
MDREVWATFTHDPRDARFAGIRASDGDRDAVQQVLAEAYADGRLDREEFDERSERGRAVRVLGDVNPLLADLVAVQPPGSRSLAHVSRGEIEAMAERHWRSRRREATFSFLGASLVTTAIWFATSWHGGGFDPYFFWPGFVIALSLLNLVRTAMSHDDIVDGEVRRLERQRAKQQRRPGWPPW